jgi:cell division protein FtsB
MNKLLAAAVSSALLGSSGAYAAVSDAEFAELKAQMAAMAQRLSTLEAENNQLRESTTDSVEQLQGAREELVVARDDLAVVRKQNEQTSWAERIKWKGDFRYRYEDIKQDSNADRNRDRIRARAELIAQTTENTTVGLGMATGGDDPVSTNQTLGGGGSTKDLRLDLAYFTWTGLEDTALTAGKFKNPYYAEHKSQLIWDGDFRPEGAAVQWASDNFFANGTYSYIESDSNSDDEVFWGAQVGGHFALFDSMQLTAAAGYLDFPTRGLESIYDQDFFGNSTVVVDGVEVYEYDYKLYHGSLGLNFSLFDMPFSVFGDYVYNDDADEYDSGYIAGISLGKAKGKGSWQLQYQYEQLDANATLGLVTDSDFMGGGTDGKGSKYSATYMLDNNWALAAAYYDGNTGVDLGNDDGYQRLQLDTYFKY